MTEYWINNRNIFFESVSSDLYYCCIDDFNGTSRLGSVVWNGGFNLRLRLTNGQTNMLILHNWCKYDYLISDNKFLKQLYTIVVLEISVKQMSDV
jgi:hypothetical protein